MIGFGKTKRLEQQVAVLTQQLQSISASAEEVQVKLSDLESMRDLFNVRSSDAGVTVTRDSAMRQSAVYSCVRIIAGAVGSIPLSVYEKTADGRSRAGWHFAESLYNAEPNSLMTAAAFWEWMLSAMLLDGDGIAIIVRNAAGEVLELLPVLPGMWRSYYRSGGTRVMYDVVFPSGVQYIFDQDDILHFPTIGFNGLRSLSAIRVGAQGVGLALAAESFGARVFSNGSMPSMVISFEGKVTEDQAEMLRKHWQDLHSGLGNSHLPAVLGSNAKVTPISISAEDAQLLDTRRFQIEDIARMLGVPPHMIGALDKISSWGSGIEQQATGFVRFTCRPHLTRIEQEVNRKIHRGGRFYAEFNPEGLMRGDSKAEADYFGAALGGSRGPGWMTVNEIRRIKNMPPIDGGDVLVNWERSGAKPTDSAVQ